MSPVALRRLPIPVAPFPDETLGSYVVRLATVNHLPHAALVEHLQEPGTPDRRPVLTRLAQLSGRLPSALRHALPELEVQQPLSRYKPPTRQGLCPRPRLACWRCTAARSVFVPVNRWVPAHLEVCVRHRRWIGSTVVGVDEQYDLGGLPEVLAAARCHHRLVRRHGHRRVAGAYNDALHITLRWAERGSYGRHRDRRLGLLPKGARALRMEPALHAAAYRETVGLTSLMVASSWVAAAASSHVGDRDRFYVEVARRLDLPEYRADTCWDPLVRWVAVDSRFALTELLQQAPRELAASAPAGPVQPPVSEIRHFH